MQPEVTQELIEAGEGDTVEFKRESIDADKLAQTIVAFNNTKGGRILFGVDDAGTPVGVKYRDRIEQTVTNVARNNVRPPLVPLFQTAQVSGQQILGVCIPKGPPCQTSKGQFYIRVGPTNRLADVDEVRVLIEGARRTPVDVKILLTSTRLGVYDIHLTIINAGYDKLREIEVSCHPFDMLKVKPFKIEELKPGQRSGTITIASEVTDEALSLNSRRSVNVEISSLSSQGQVLRPVEHKVTIGELKADWDSREKQGRLERGI